MSETKEKATIKMVTEVELDEELIVDLLCDAEIGYWGHYDNTGIRNLEKYLKKVVAGTATIDVLELEGDDDEPEVHKLSRASIELALSKLHTVAGGRYVSDLTNENYDAETSDVLVQLAVLGEVRYG